MPNIRFVHVDMETIHSAQELSEKYGLKPRDSIHAATALKANASELLSFDADFDSLPSIKRREP
ncbi:MAG: type II toxin-antitoxin system VapC family toxin [Nitrososphaerota archaeon]|nr:type II toxin-antitoxin system VapC family toxin [Nitrososphaerota archaeon]MDG6940046.1 type II toxin-antitoxin system VapC family toxin [Nitrososphaerota archaeon]